MSKNRIRVRIPGLIPPGFQRSLPATGIVTETGEIDVDALEATLRMPDDADVDPGQTVTVSLDSDGHLYAITAEQQTREQYEQKAQAYLRAREQRQRRQQKQNERKEFWTQFDIPVEFATAQNNRLSELRSGSTGTGSTEHTVTHLRVLEPVSDGRLEREAGRFLCLGEGKYADSAMGLADVESASLDDVDEMPPRVTCSTCLERMERWKTEPQSEADRDGGDS